MIITITKFLFIKNRINSTFSLTSGYYQINAMCRVSDYEPNPGSLILFFSTNGSNFSGNVNASYPQVFGNRRSLQDDESLNLNITIKLTATSTCCLMAQPVNADTSSGFSINERSWLSVVKIRDV